MTSTFVSRLLVISLSMPEVLSVPGSSKTASSAGERLAEWWGAPHIYATTSLPGMFETISEAAHGEFVLIVGEGATPDIDLLNNVHRVIAAHPLADVAYGGDTLPDWSPHRLLHENYVGETLLIRTSFLVSLTARELGSERWDAWSFLLACIRVGATVVHDTSRWIDTSVRGDRGAMSTSDGVLHRHDVEQIQHHLSMMGSHRTASAGPRVGLVCVNPASHQALPSHAFITLTAGSGDPGVEGGRPFIYQHLGALQAMKTQPTEHIVVVGVECDSAVLEELEQRASRDIALLPVQGPFNFAHRCNVAALHAQSEVLIFTNDDFIPQRADWVDQLLAPFEDPLVGITGATLVYDDGSIQHAGVATAFDNYHHPNHGVTAGDSGWDELTTVNREADAVTGACFAIRRSLFDRVGGFTESFPLNFNDVDLCLKVRKLGYSVIQVAPVLGIHHESKTRPAVLLEAETALMRRRWPDVPSRSAYPFNRTDR
jgi:GT2 family glycosyltransferase